MEWPKSQLTTQAVDRRLSNHLTNLDRRLSNHLTINPFKTFSLPYFKYANIFRLATGIKAASSGKGLTTCKSQVAGLGSLL